MSRTGTLEAIEVAIPARSRRGAPLDLPGSLAIPDDPRGIVLFAHGSGSGRQSPRNRLVAGVLHEGGLATLLFDLLTPEESAERVNVFDIDLLAERLLDALRFVSGRPDVATLPLGVFGASTGAAAGLVAAARERRVRAVVSRGGRPDLAGPCLAKVHVPALLIVGSLDEDVLELNRRALDHLGGAKQLSVIRGASHLFEEEGTLAEAARLAAEWFRRYLLPAPRL